MKDITILMDVTVGRVADLLEGLATAGVELVAGCFFPRLEGRVAHLTVPDDQAKKARDVATKQGLAVLDEQDVLVIQPGTLGTIPEIARKVADAGGEVYVAYFGTQGEIVLGTSNLEVTRSALGLG